MIQNVSYYLYMDTFAKELSKQVAIFKIENGLTAAGLAALLNLSTVSVNSKMNGNRRWTLADLGKLADLGVKIPSFAGWDGK